MPRRTPRALPAKALEAPLSLDTLAARLVQPQRPSEAPWTPPRHRRPTIAPHTPHPPTGAPQALVLPVTVATCTGCGTVTRSPSPYALVRYSLNSYTFHYSRALDAETDGLPREIRESKVTIPFCEACFVVSESRVGCDTTLAVTGPPRVAGAFTDNSASRTAEGGSANFSPSNDTSTVANRPVAATRASVIGEVEPVSTGYGSTSPRVFD